MARRLTQIEKAIAVLEREITARQDAIAILRAQQPPTRRIDTSVFGGAQLDEAGTAVDAVGTRADGKRS
jgi:hypothetical protein